MYNLKEIHESKTRTNAEAPNKVLEIPFDVNSKDSNGATNIGSNQGAFRDDDFLKIFDGFKLYRNGKIRTKRGKFLSNKKPYYKINGQKIDKKQIFELYKDFVHIE